MTKFCSSLSLVSLFAFGCAAPMPKPCVDANSAPPAGTATTPTARGSALKTCANPSAPPDGIVEDFEDGNSQAVVLDGRDGYWWTHHDPNGSTIQPEKFAPADGGANGSAKALHVQGTTATGGGAYGSSVGVNFTSSGLYDASKYAGISFKAKVGPNSTKNVRLKIGDANTHGELGTCRNCWNHFGKDFELSTEWQEYRVLFVDATQQPGWGDPRPSQISPDKLASIDFTIAAGTTFDLWVDDVQLLTCP